MPISILSTDDLATLAGHAADDGQLSAMFEKMAKRAGAGEFRDVVALMRNVVEYCVEVIGANLAGEELEELRALRRNPTKFLNAVEKYPTAPGQPPLIPTVVQKSIWALNPFVNSAKHFDALEGDWRATASLLLGFLMEVVNYARVQAGLTQLPRMPWLHPAATRPELQEVVVGRWTVHFRHGASITAMNIAVDGSGRFQGDVSGTPIIGRWSTSSSSSIVLETTSSLGAPIRTELKFGEISFDLLRGSDPGGDVESIWRRAHER